MNFQIAFVAALQRAATSGVSTKLLSPFAVINIGFGLQSIKTASLLTFSFRTGAIALRRSGSCVNC